MRKHSDVKQKMPFFDSLKTAAAVGLLMQHSTALYCQEVHNVISAPLAYHYDIEKEAGELKLDEAISVIKDLTSVLNRAYFLLLNAHDEDREFVIATLDQEKSELVELQLRGLEGAIRNVYKECTEGSKAAVKPVYVLVAQARSAAVKVNDLMKQMTKPVETFTSSIDMEGLRALAKHGTETFISGRFH